MEYGPTSINNVRSFLEGPQRAVLSTVGREGATTWPSSTTGRPRPPPRERAREPTGY